MAARRLFGVRHKAGGGYPPDVRDFYKLFFLCEPEGGGRVRAGAESSDARFFGRGELPPLSPGRTAAADVEAAFAYAADPVLPAFFD